MDTALLEQVVPAFRTFFRQFAPLFGRSDTATRIEQYVRGLLVQTAERRNVENVAEAVAGATPRALQRVITDSPWDHTAVVTALQARVATHLSTPDGIFILDETGFAKQGTHSAGVARQYSGTLGKVGNCQIGVFLAYASPHGHALIDGQLYIPKAWTDDTPRLDAAGIPRRVGYQSKTDLALTLLHMARTRQHFAGQWVVGDEAYGQVPHFRDSLDAHHWLYLLEVPSITRVFVAYAAAAVPAYSGRGGRPTQPRRLPDTPAPQTVATVAALPQVVWQTLTVAEGAQGPRRYQFSALRVWECRGDIPGRACWLVLRRNLDGTELKWYLSNAPETTALHQLGHVAAQRWRIEEEFKHTKSGCGLDEYEVRSWRGWYHHMTLALLAGAFLLDQQQEWKKKDAGDHPTPDPAGGRGVVAAAVLDGPPAMAMADPHAAAQCGSNTIPCQTAGGA